MMLCIGVEQPPDHALVLSVMFPSLALEELDASLAQCEGDLDAFISKDEFLRPRKEVRNDLEVSERFAGVLDFLPHTFACLSGALHGSAACPADSDHSLVTTERRQGLCRASEEYLHYRLRPPNIRDDAHRLARVAVLSKCRSPSRC